MADKPIYIGDLPEDIIGVIADYSGALGCTVLSHVSRMWADAVRGRVLDPEDVCSWAARDDYFEVLQWAGSAGYAMLASPNAAAKNGNLEMLEWIQDNGDSWEIETVRTTCKCAVVAGHLHILKWMIENDYNLDWNMLYKAARYDHRHIIEWIVETDICTRNDINGVSHRFTINAVAFRKAAKGRQFELLKWMKENGPQPCTWNDLTPCAAAKHGSVEILEWLRAEGCPFGSNVGLGAAGGGHIPVLKWLCSVGFDLNPAMRNVAAGNGYIHVLEWLDEMGCPSSRHEYKFAARYGHIGVIKWLIDKGRLLDRDYVCWHAASGGQLELLKWLHSDGYPCNESVCEAAVESGHFDVLKWLFEVGCPCNLEYCATIVVAPLLWRWLSKRDKSLINTNNSLKILEYLHSEGCPMDSVYLCSNAARVGNLTMLKWLREKGCPWDAETCAAAGERGYILDWIHANGCPCEHTICQ